MSSSRSCFHLFVYGTLRSRFTKPYALMLHRSSALVGVGRVRGRLQHFKHYFAIDLESTTKKWIPGEIYRLRDLRVLAALDRYEGPNFPRVVVEVSRSDNSRQRCWIYRLKREAL